MIDDDRLLRYATAIATEELDYLFGEMGGHQLPSDDHPRWTAWKRTATVVIQLADTEHPPPPGSTVKKLPEHILRLIVPRPYLSTACQTAGALRTAQVRHPEHLHELQMWEARMHEECRLNNKFTDKPCSCPCNHPKKP
jgi:hypothetical protein